MNFIITERKDYFNKVNNLNQIKLNYINRKEIKDIVLPKGVEILGDPETTVALVDAPRTEADMASLDEKVTADVTKVEGVIKEEAPQA